MLRNTCCTDCEVTVIRAAQIYVVQKMTTAAGFLALTFIPMLIVYCS
jgi:hypothetical protein